MRLGASLFTLLLLVAASGGCVADEPDSESTDAPEPGANGPFIVVSTSFADGGDIPRQHTCDGAETSPSLSVLGLPNGTATIALLMGDPDVPTPIARQRNLTHWTLWNPLVVDGAVLFPEGGIPAGSVEGANDGAGTGYLGPCPPVGSPAHRYIFTVYALDAPLDLAGGASRAEFDAAIDGRVIGMTSVTGMYARAVVTPS